jgi:ankyrin repeat protein
VTTPFHCAAAAHDILLIRRLSRLGYNINTVDRIQETAVFQAATQLFLDSGGIFENFVLLRTLCEEGADVNFTTNSDGDTYVLYHLFRHNIYCDLHPRDLPLYVEGVRLLLKYGASPHRALHAVALHKLFVPFVRMLLEVGADIEEVWRDMSPLARAASLKNLDVVKALIDADANIDGSGKVSPLFATIKHAPREDNGLTTTSTILTTLCDAGADTRRVNDENHSILSYILTVSCRDIDPFEIPPIVKILCKYGSDVNFRHDRVESDCAEAGDTPLHFAAATRIGGRMGAECMEILISHGANVNSQNNAGRTPLHLAVELSDIPCAEVLLKHGARMDLKDFDGETAIMLAEDLKWQNEEMYAFLVEQKGMRQFIVPLESSR